MTATNINIAEFIDVLSQIYSTGVTLIDLDMIPDDNHPKMNKLIIHPQKLAQPGSQPSQPENKVIYRDPRISTDNNDIFDSFKDLV